MTVLIVEKGKINNQLHDCLKSAMIHVDYLVNIFAEHNVDEADAALFVSLMLVDGLKKCQSKLRIEEK